jgi:hypothetical protein
VIDADGHVGEVRQHRVERLPILYGKQSLKAWLRTGSRKMRNKALSLRVALLAETARHRYIRHPKFRY